MEKDAYDYYIKANEQYNSGEIEDAIHLFLKSLEMDYHFKTYEKLYWCYNHLQQYDLANYFIKRAYEENSNNDKVAYLYAKVLIDKKQIGNAREILSGIIKRNPSYKKRNKSICGFRNTEAFQWKEEKARSRTYKCQKKIEKVSDICIDYFRKNAFRQMYVTVCRRLNHLSDDWPNEEAKA